MKINCKYRPARYFWPSVAPSPNPNPSVRVRVRVRVWCGIAKGRLGLSYNDKIEDFHMHFQCMQHKYLLMPMYGKCRVDREAIYGTVKTLQASLWDGWERSIENKRWNIRYPSICNCLGNFTDTPHISKRVNRICVFRLRQFASEICLKLIAS